MLSLLEFRLEPESDSTMLTFLELRLELRPPVFGSSMPSSAFLLVLLWKLTRVFLFFIRLLVSVRINGRCACIFFKRAVACFFSCLREG